MASNGTVSASTQPLSMMTKLSPFVYIYEPDKETLSQQQPQPQQPAAPPATPKLILIASWMDAQDSHIAKYLAQYQSIYPHSTILLVKFAKSGIFLASSSRPVQPAISYLRSGLSSGFLSASPARPEILVHVFSNGGSITMQNLYRAFREQTGRAFPLHAAVYDSCPGLYSFGSAYNAMILGFPGAFARLVAAPLICALILGLWVCHYPLKFLFGEDVFLRNARVLNDRDLVEQRNRSYIYGRADVMVDWRDVEKHATAASAAGIVVRRELFDRSPHVSHMRTDGERYWRIVTETWEKSLVGI
ncbi:hypothetical protein F4779DRAFT_596501 [Xylariaceae sp. FL0662B]|nr:hypothetical protein F4779DRAFT_596501 [Xylariaceae sp. FL0662B]